MAMSQNRPIGREKHITGPGKTVRRRGEGLGSGPVGNAGGYQERQQSSGARSAGGLRGGGLRLIVLLLAAAETRPPSWFICTERIWNPAAAWGARTYKRCSTPALAAM